MTPLRRRMTEDMNLRNFAPKPSRSTSSGSPISPSTSTARPNTSAPRVRGLPAPLIQERHVSWSYYNQARCACGSSTASPWADGSSDVVCPKQRKLPVVLSRTRWPGSSRRSKSQAPRHAHDRLRRRPARLRGPRLRVADIDSRRMVIHVRQGKGRKDRYVDALAAVAGGPPRVLED